MDIESELRKRTDEVLSHQLEHYASIQENRIQKKLCNLCGGWVPLAKPRDGYIDLSDTPLTDDQRELLNLSTNYVYMPKYSSETKKAELEILYQDICKLRTQNKIIVNQNLQDQLRAESTKIVTDVTDQHSTGTLSSPRGIPTAEHHRHSCSTSGQIATIRDPEQ